MSGLNSNFHMGGGGNTINDTGGTESLERKEASLRLSSAKLSLGCFMMSDFDVHAHVALIVHELASALLTLTEEQHTEIVAVMRRFYMCHIVRDHEDLLLSFESLTKDVDSLEKCIPPDFKNVDYYIQFVQRRFGSESPYFKTFKEILSIQIEGEMNLQDFYGVVCFLFRDQVDIIKEFQCYGFNFLKAQQMAISNGGVSVTLVDIPATVTSLKLRRYSNSMVESNQSKLGLRFASPDTITSAIVIFQDALGAQRAVLASPILLDGHGVHVSELNSSVAGESVAEEDIGRHGRHVPSGIGNAIASSGLEGFSVDIQDYTNEFETRLLSRFGAACERKDTLSMSAYVQILTTFHRGVSAIQQYILTRPMLMDAEVMNVDAILGAGDLILQVSPSNVSRGLALLYKEISESVLKEATTIMLGFPSPDIVMKILVQLVLEFRIISLLNKLLVKPSLVNLPPVAQGGVLSYLRILEVAYKKTTEKTGELARNLQAVGCGDLGLEGNAILTMAFFYGDIQNVLLKVYFDNYPLHEQASLRQLFQAKMEELCAENHTESSGTIGGSRGVLDPFSEHQISLLVVTEFVRWNEEAIARCSLFSSEPATLASNVKAVFTCLLAHVGQYITEGIERARVILNEAVAAREIIVVGTSVSRKEEAAIAASASAAESSFKSFMDVVKRCASSVGIVKQYFKNSISQLLLPVDGAHFASLEEMAAAVSRAEVAAYEGLQQCVETLMAEAERLLSASQIPPDYLPPEDGMVPDLRVVCCTNYCLGIGSHTHLTPDYSNCQTVLCQPTVVKLDSLRDAHSGERERLR
ncbi:hypothetical protein C5167_005001 [Papaver somniferum]|uniref:Exocyst complex component Sec10-like alpha-helical bundle domain-containing protein n=1 Tax=Papaver somniferum TaxID=3469 RepID=A0A4Y7JD74_PAPSO|nr:hypothetical protein C5167_005001 [Papaver somniferum]